jgi:uncharacterized RDD family membrane protein YckC
VGGDEDVDVHVHLLSPALPGRLVTVSDLVTGEAVVLELRLAQLPSRAIAFAVDTAIMALGLASLLLPAGALAGGVDDSLATALLLVTVVAVVIGYPTLWETLTRGRTPGKYLLGLRVVRDDGGPIRFRQALVRALAGFFVDFWALGLFGCVALVVSLISPQGKRVGDLLAGTVVVRERVPVRGGPLAQMPPQLAAWAATLHLSALPDDLALAVRQYLSRVPELNPGVASDMGRRLAADVARYVGQDVPPDVPAWAYLSAVLAERRRRELARLGVPQPQPSGPPAQPSGPSAPPPGPSGPSGLHAPLTPDSPAPSAPAAPPGAGPPATPSTPPQAGPFAPPG